MCLRPYVGETCMTFFVDTAVSRHMQTEEYDRGVHTHLWIYEQIEHILGVNPKEPGVRGAKWLPVLVVLIEFDWCRVDRVAGFLQQYRRCQREIRNALLCKARDDLL